ncbi:hypothetical protein TorRG33x02_342230 [Trema orientale]|uniref:Uncharacterized protein n=1 Tax=Trema orientale TaxID=63057 RepID=A0A2P5ASV9_TREOI|nr:hypothetical protein TorRG33x02_342230 [Trema orientale]
MPHFRVAYEVGEDEDDDDDGGALLVFLACGCSGGSGGGDLDKDSSLVLLLLSELLMATAKASVLRLELIGLFDIPLPLLLSGKLRFFSQT